MNDKWHHIIDMNKLETVDEGTGLEHVFGAWTTWSMRRS